MTTDAQVMLFLVSAKQAIADGNFSVIPRSKNNDFLARLGVTPKEREAVIHSLQVGDYVSGPEQDLGVPGEQDIWIFKKEYLDREIYIKIKLIKMKTGFYAKCLSFHD